MKYLLSARNVDNKSRPCISVHLSSILGRIGNDYAEVLPYASRLFNILHYLHNTNKEASSIWQLMICKCCLLFSNLVHFRLISTYL